MKIIVSSKYLASKLKVNFDQFCINTVFRTDEGIRLEGTFPDPIEIYCEVRHEYKPAIDTSSCRWDWVKNLMDQVEDQPVVLDIQKTRVRVMFDY